MNLHVQPKASREKPSEANPAKQPFSGRTNTGTTVKPQRKSEEVGNRAGFI